MQEKLKFYHNTDEEVDGRDSMMNLSDTGVAWVKGSKGSVSIAIRGEVRVEYKGSVYTNWCDFPQELKNLFNRCKAWLSDEVFIDENNWFNLEFRDKESYLVDDFTYDESLPLYKGKINWNKLKKILTKIYFAEQW